MPNGYFSYRTNLYLIYLRDETIVNRDIKWLSAYFAQTRPSGHLDDVLRALFKKQEKKVKELVDRLECSDNRKEKLIEYFEYEQTG